MQVCISFADMSLALAKAAWPPLMKFYLRSLLGRNDGNGISLSPPAQWSNYIINQINYTVFTSIRVSKSSNKFCPACNSKGKLNGEERGPFAAITGKSSPVLWALLCGWTRPWLFGVRAEDHLQQLTQGRSSIFSVLSRLVDGRLLLSPCDTPWCPPGVSFGAASTLAWWFPSSRGLCCVLPPCTEHPNPPFTVLNACVFPIVLSVSVLPSLPIWGIWCSHPKQLLDLWAG